MRQKFNTPETLSERLVRDFRRSTRKQYSAEEKIHVVLYGLRGEVSIAELCRGRQPTGQLLRCVLSPRIE